MTQVNSNQEATPEKDEYSASIPVRRGWPRWNMQQSRHVLIGCVLFLLALGFDLYRLGNPGIWFDEAFSVELARLPLAHLWHLIFGPEPNMELYYLFLHYWLRLTALFGLHQTEVVVRLPSVVFAALSCVVVFAIGLRFLGLPGGALATTLYLLNDLQLLYAQQARSYSLQLLLTCLAWYALLTILSSTQRDGTKRWWLCYVITSVLAIYAHLFSVLILLAQCVAVAGLLCLPTSWQAQTRRQIPAFAISLCSSGILSIPMLLVSLQGAKTGWLPVPQPRDVLYFFYTMTGYSKGYTVALGACCILGLLLVVIGFVRQRRLSIQEQAAREKQDPSHYLPIAWSLLCWSILPLVMSYILSLGSIRLFSSRYLVAVVPPIMLLAGLCMAALCRPVTRIMTDTQSSELNAAFARQVAGRGMPYTAGVNSGFTRRFWLLPGIVLALVMIILALRAVPYYYRSAQVEDWNSTAHWLEQRYQAKDGLVCYDNTLNGPVKQGCQIAVEYYLHAYPSAAHFTADTPGAFSWATYSTPDPNAALDPGALSAYAVKHPRLILIIGRVQNAAGDQRVQTALRWLNEHYHSVDQVKTRTVKMYIFATH